MGNSKVRITPDQRCADFPKFFMAVGRLERTRAGMPEKIAGRASAVSGIAPSVPSHLPGFQAQNGLCLSKIKQMHAAIRAPRCMGCCTHDRRPPGLVKTKNEVALCLQQCSSIGLRLGYDRRGLAWLGLSKVILQQGLLPCA